MTWSRTVILLLVLINCALFAGETHAAILQSKVVDAETNEPLEGAVVVVVWRRHVFVPCMDGCSTFHDAAEAITDNQGNFAVDISMGWLANDRNITVYKPGYYLPSSTAFPWLFSKEDPPPNESRLVRLIKAPSLLAESKGYAYSPSVCLPNESSGFCVPARKIRQYAKVREIIHKLRDSKGQFTEPSTQQPALHGAVSRHDPALVRLLLKNGASPNERDSEGRTALMVATQIAQPHRWHPFISRGPRQILRGPPELFEQLNKGRIENGVRSIEIVRILLDAGADPNLKANDGNVALIFAFPPGLQIGARADRSNPELATFVSPKLVKLLLEAGANPNVRAYDGLTPLMIAAGRGLAETVEPLLAHGADINAKADFGITAYQVASGPDVIAAMKSARGPKKRLPTPPGTTLRSTNNLLRDAAWNGNAAVVRILIVDEGADPNFRDESSQETPIYAAIRSADVATVETLLNHGASLSVSAPHAGSPLAFAHKALKPEIASRITKILVAAETKNDLGK